MKPTCFQPNRLYLLPLVGLLVFPATFRNCTAADEPEASDVRHVAGWVRLAGGDHLGGKLRGSSPADALVWDHEGFSPPFRFDLRHVIGAAFPAPKKNTDPEADDTPDSGREFVVELNGDDRLSGQFVAIDPQSITLETVEFGRVTIKRDAIDRVLAIGTHVMHPFVGPQGLSDWTSEGNLADWRNTGGRLSTGKQDSSIFRGGLLSGRARIEVELSWDKSPDFVLALGVDENGIEQSTGSAFRLEVWDGQIVLLRELEQAAHLVPLGNVADFDRVFSLHIDLDQASGTIACRVGSNPSAVPVELSSNEPLPANSGIRLIHLSGGIHLDSIQVSSLPPNDASPAGKQDFLTLKTGSELRGQLTGIAEGRWIVATEAGEQRVDPDDVAEIYFAGSAENRGTSGDTGSEPPADTEPPADAEPPRVFRAITHSGSRLTGAWRGISDGRLSLAAETLLHPATIPISQLSRLNVSQRSKLPKYGTSGPAGRLEFPDGELHGKLVRTPPDTRPTPVQFQPRGSTAVTLSGDFSGCLYYREPPAPETAIERQVREERERRLEAQRARGAAQQRNAPGILNLLSRAFLKQDRPAEQSYAAKSIQLKSGEKLPCEVHGIDEDSVRFKSELTDQTELPRSIIRAVHLVGAWGEPELDPVHRKRLLTVPRVGKKRPPSHLVIAKNGDLLRCRLIRLTDEIAEVETRLETVEIDRSLIASIVWLDDPSKESAGEETAKNPDERLTVRALMKDNHRISLVPDQVTESAVVGTHPFLGSATIELRDAHELVFGTYVSRSDFTEPFQQWNLHNAPEPMIAGDGEGGGRELGTASKLVGAPAPDFQLDFLGGGSFHVAEQKGKVLVLDFWATWCGPCIQAMPVIDQAVSEFDADRVSLISVNLQESADAIRETLERIGLSPRVVLDIDGVAAARYQVDAIPQTVVIDRRGIVRRVFIGSGQDLCENLKAAIEQQLSDDGLEYCSGSASIRSVAGRSPVFVAGVRQRVERELVNPSGSGVVGLLHCLGNPELSRSVARPSVRRRSGLAAARRVLKRDPTCTNASL